MDRKGVFHEPKGFQRGAFRDAKRNNPALIALLGVPSIYGENLFPDLLGRGEK
jgi:hypothetical protein